MNNTFTVTLALPSDIKEIMMIEEAAFPQGIRECADTFMERLMFFPAGNTVLLKNDNTQNVSRRLAGYFCSELWNEIPPQEPAFYILDHSIKNRHFPNGKYLYISSLAVASKINGKGRFLFTESLRLICSANPQIRSIILLVNDLWIPARHIYETEGFRYIGRFSSFFTAIEKDEKTSISDGLLMRKDLP
jgi:ribosomal-protein-alanine N-acetyltransferase